MRCMRLAVQIAICLLSASLAFGQGGSPPASTTESGATSGHGMTAAEQTGKGVDNTETPKTVMRSRRASGRKMALLLCCDVTPVTTMAKGDTSQPCRMR
jgi:hypothetical protein